jgi:zinc/manganese transport system substrate-binding protein
MSRAKISSIVIVIILLVGITAAVNHRNTGTGPNGHKLQVVAAENFWGSLAAQLGGNRIHVTSIVSDPNADPHEYASNTGNARLFATANYVVLNGVGYDSWANKLLGAQPAPQRKVLTVGTLVGKQDGDNPHLWYDPAYVNQAVARMDQDLIALDPSGKGYYQQQLKNLQAGLSGYQNRLASIKHQFGGTKVAATEDIFAYLADAAGLDLVSPPAFIQAVAEGNDPPTDSVVTFQQQLQSGQVKVLVYNQQTVTPLTDSIKKLAADNNIPIVGVTETVQPPDTTFQDWMNAELISLENALNAKALGH